MTLVREPGAAPERRTIRVNEPLEVSGAHVYLAGNGYAPLLTVRDGNRDIAVSGQVPFLAQDANYTSEGVVKAADAAPRQLGLQGLFLPTAVVTPETGPVSVFPDARAPRLFFTAWVGDLGLDGGVPQSVYELDTSELTQLQSSDGQPFTVALAPGETVELPDGAGSVTFEELTRFAGLTIRHDPGKEAALAFAVLAMLGLVTSLFMPRRRVWVRATSTGGSGGASHTVVQVAALARGEDSGLDAEAEAVERAVLDRFDRPAEAGGRRDPLQ